MELFVGLDFPGDVKQELERIQSSLLFFDPSGAYEPIENYHLTLHYIGELSNADAIIERLMQINCKPFKLSLHELGLFDIAGGNVVWVNVREEPCLHDLQGKINRKLADMSTSKEQYSFAPHISLAYNCSLNISDVFSFCPVSSLSFEVSHFYLYEVKYLPEGLRFRKLNDFKLKG
ncbi:RNA 2',3'-cyclic phosphodiesterase [Paenibacillus sepulcri]|uniref:RNA 2',3'-cyclic phosphodiesterase n=1 Tax=Paenibacillus sepulcri TaxID=359917 RepID=A0ABS7BYC9_9BACL|nr:RNA 2',3'-cyclic phosphodiesterase [Paenibacillus sepulcri]